MKYIGKDKNGKKMFMPEECDRCNVCGGLDLFKECDSCHKKVGTKKGYKQGYKCIIFRLRIPYLAINIGPKHFCSLGCVMKWILSKF